MPQIPVMGSTTFVVSDEGAMRCVTVKVLHVAWDGDMLVMMLPDEDDLL